MQIVEDILCNGCLLWCCGSSKFVKVTIKPLVDLFVDGMVLVTDLSWSLSLLSGLCLSGSSILVSAANVEDIVACKSSEPSIHVSREHTSNDVTQVWHIVDVRKCTGDEDVAFASKR